jgi:hypothetical protein
LKSPAGSSVAVEDDESCFVFEEEDKNVDIALNEVYEDKNERSRRLHVYEENKMDHSHGPTTSIQG